MDNNPIFRQVIDFNKASFQQSFNTMEIIQDQTEMITETLWNNANLLPREAKCALDEWKKACRNGRDELKKAVEDGYRKLESLIVEPVSKEGEKTGQ